jgi:hypothetical protein
MSGGADGVAIDLEVLDQAVAAASGYARRSDQNR